MATVTNNNKPELTLMDFLVRVFVLPVCFYGCGIPVVALTTYNEAYTLHLENSSQKTNTPEKYYNFNMEIWYVVTLIITLLFCVTMTLASRNYCRAKYRHWILISSLCGILTMTINGGITTILIRLDLQKPYLLFALFFGTPIFIGFIGAMFLKRRAQIK